MIYATLSQAQRYAALHPLFPTAFAYMRNTDLHSLSSGCHRVVEEQLYAIVEQQPGRTRASALLECHRKYIDIQLVLQGVDEMGWRSLSECTQALDDYNEDKDIQFFRDAPSTWIKTPPGSFCIFFPEDAHAPLVSDGEIRKVIFKIAVS